MSRRQELYGTIVNNPNTFQKISECLQVPTFHTVTPKFYYLKGIYNHKFQKDSEWSITLKIVVGFEAKILTYEILQSTIPSNNDI